MYFVDRMMKAEQHITPMLPPNTADYEWQIKHKKGCPLAAKVDPGPKVPCRCTPVISFNRFFTPVAIVDDHGDVKMLLTALQIADLERPEEWTGTCLHQPKPQK